MDINTYSCLAIVSLIILITYFYEIKIGRFYDSHDGLISILAGYKLTGRGYFWFIIWFLISFILGILFPILYDENTGWFHKQNGLLITINYTLVVPALVGAYVGLFRESKLFFDKSNMHDLGINWKSPWIKFRYFNLKSVYVVSKIILLISTIFITNVAIKSIISTENYLESPWVIDDYLSLAGVFYYALRGINAYLAMGLIFISLGLFFIFTFNITQVENSRFLTPQIKVKDSIHKLTMKLVSCALLAPIVTALHGVALLNEVKANPDNTSSYEGLGLLHDSGWLYWVALAFIATCFLVYGVIWFYKRIKEEIDDIESNMRNNIDNFYESEKPSLASYSDKLDAYNKLQTFIDSINITPIPKSALAAIAASFLIQLLNISVTVYNAFK